MSTFSREPTGTAVFVHQGQVHCASYWLRRCLPFEMSEGILDVSVTIIYRRREKTSPLGDRQMASLVAQALLADLVLAPPR